MDPRNYGSGLQPCTATEAPESNAQGAARRWSRAKDELERARIAAMQAADTFAKAQAEEQDAWAGLEVASERGLPKPETAADVVRAHSFPGLR